MPDHFGIRREDHQLLKGITVEQIVHAGLSALQGETGSVQDLLIFQTAALLWLSRLISNEIEAARLATEIIQSKKAWKHWQNQS